jgi:hypothetical protein
VIEEEDRCAQAKKLDTFAPRLLTQAELAQGNARAASRTAASAIVRERFQVQWKTFTLFCRLLEQLIDFTFVDSAAWWTRIADDNTSFAISYLSGFSMYAGRGLI